MRAILKYGAICTGLVIASVSLSMADSQPPVVGGVLPDFTLSVPGSDEHRKYLGVEGKDAFNIPEIRADVVIIEIFSMY